MLVKVLEDSEQKEFVVSQGSEFARVGRKGIIFKVFRILVVYYLFASLVIFVKTVVPAVH